MVASMTIARPSKDMVITTDADVGPRGVGRWLLGTAATLVLLCLVLLQVHDARQSVYLQRRVLELQSRLELVETVLFVNTGDSETPRRRRSVPGSGQLASVAGIPVHSQPYGHRGQHGRRAHDHLPPRLTVYDDLSSETTDDADDGRQSSVMPHHRSSAVFPVARLGRVNIESDSTGGDTESPLPADQPASASTTRPVSHRRSRVPVHKAKKHRKGRLRSRTRKWAAGKRAKAARRRMEARGPATGYALPENNRERQERRNRRLMKRISRHLHNTLGAAAAHFEGHSSNYSLSHRHYEGNGVLRNVQSQSVFVDWHEAQWMHRLGYSEQFVLEGGRVTVRRPGIYYLYAQINYKDRHDISGFEIQINRRPFIKCVVMEGSNSHHKVNTCHTGAATYLQSGDSVAVRDIEPERFSMFLPDRSFFGLVRLAGSEPE